MDCRQCGTPVEKPGDFCLTCRTENADAVVVDAGTDRATVTVLDGESVVGETTVTTTPETGERERTERRNFAGRVADEARRKRPEAVFVAGDRDVLTRLRDELRYECRRVPAENPVEEARERRGERTLAVVEKPPAEKIGGSHSTLIGGRDGRRVVHTVADHPNVKKVIPGPIEAGGASSRGGVRAKATRADEHGNVRLLLRDGSSVQENRVVTTAKDREGGDRVRADLSGLLGDGE
jgi:hypothetical protein